MDLQEHFLFLANLCEKYDLARDTLDQDLQEMKLFNVIVPVIGAFNTGKSALLNTLLDTQLLPVSVTTETLAPLVLTHGAGSVIILRNGRAQRADLSVLQRGALDFEGVSILRAALPSPFLEKIPNLHLVDTPGIGTSAAVQNLAMLDVLHCAAAYLLVFGADAPVITESMAAILAELRLEHRIVFPVLTKCDKFTPDEVIRIKRYLENSLAEQLNLPDAAVCCIYGKTGEGIDLVKDFLLQLQVKSDAIRTREFSARLYNNSLPLLRYLEQRITNNKLLAPELEQRAKTIAVELEQLHDAMEELDERCDQQIQYSAHTAAAHAMQKFSGLVQPLADMLASGQNPASYADSALNSLLRAGARGELDVILASYKNNVRRLAGLYGVTDAFPHTGQENSCVKAVLEQFHGTARIFEKHNNDINALLATLEPLLTDCFAKGAYSTISALRETLSKPLYAGFVSLQKALQNIRSQQDEETKIHRDALEELQCDLDALLQIRAELNDVIAAKEKNIDAV